MTLVVINCYILDVFPLMICVPLHIDYYISLLNITLNIRCMLWGMCHMLAERHVVMPLWRSVCIFKKKKKRLSQLRSPVNVMTKSSNTFKEMCYSYITFSYINSTSRHIGCETHTYEIHMHESHTLCILVWSWCRVTWRRKIISHFQKHTLYKL